MHRCTWCTHGDRPSRGREARAGRGGALQTSHRVTPWHAVHGVRARGGQRRSLGPRGVTKLVQVGFQPQVEASTPDKQEASPVKHNTTEKAIWRAFCGVDPAVSLLGLCVPFFGRFGLCGDQMTAELRQKCAEVGPSRLENGQKLRPKIPNPEGKPRNRAGHRRNTQTSPQNSHATMKAAGQSPKQPVNNPNSRRVHGK